jgi:hypothetical protein
VETEHGRELQGVGEIHNNLQTAVAGTQFQLRLKSSPTVIAGGVAGGLGGGEILKGGDVAFSFTIPLSDSDKPEVEVVGIEGVPLRLEAKPIAVKNVRKERVSSDTWQISGSFTNPSASDGLRVDNIYFNLRGRKGQIVGTSTLLNGWIPPAGTATFSQTVTALAPVASAGIEALGAPGSEVIPPS